MLWPTGSVHPRARSQTHAVADGGAVGDGGQDSQTQADFTYFIDKHTKTGAGERTGRVLTNQRTLAEACLNLIGGVFTAESGFRARWLALLLRGGRAHNGEL